MKQSDLLSQWKKRKSSTTKVGIQSRPTDTPARPSAGQRRLFLLQQLHPGNPFYQYAHRYEFRGKLDVVKLQQSLEWLINRQEVLRSNYSMDATGEIIMTFQPAANFTLEQADEQAMSEEKLAAAESHYCLRPFDLGSDLLFRAKLFPRGEEVHRLLISMHHIIGDRGSLMVLEQELFSYYTKLVEGEELPPAKAPTLGFADYAYWEASREVPETHYDYWKTELGGELPYAKLPYDFPRPPVGSFRGKLLTKELPTILSNQVHQLARTHGTTPNVIFLAVLNAFLYRYTGQEDLLVGAPISTRDRTEFEALIGFLNETVVLRNQLSPQQGLNHLISKLKPKVETALAYKDVPFEWLVDELAEGRSAGENPFFQTMFVYNGAAPERVLPAGLTVADQYLDLGTSKFDLSLFATDHRTHFSIGFEFTTDLFEEDTVAAMLDHFSVLLKETVTDPTSPIHTCALLTVAEQQQIVVDWNPTLGEHLEAPLLPQLFARRAVENPTATAITDGNTALSYGELAANSAALAVQLLEEGLRPNSPVGLYCGRTTDLLVGILGIMRAGGAYVPLDPEYPADRLEMIIADADIRLLVHQQELSPPPTEGIGFIGIPRGKTVGKDLDLPAIAPEQTAYIIYTSGSTGRPKGIPISHENLAHSTAARFAFYSEPPNAFLLLSSFAFDSSVAGIFWTLAHGGKLVVSAPRAEQDPASLGQLIRSEGVSHTLLLPTLYQLLLEFSQVEDLASLQLVMVAGEACPASLVSEHYAKLPGTSLVNEYGPTEGTVWSTAHRIMPDDATTGVPIGRPIHGVGHYVLDRHLQPIPVGVVGELYLSGPTLTEGYLGRPDLTEERFIELNLGAAAGARQRLYKTGDLVRYRKNGLLDFLGRSDNQVKIRGHRIEPAEISKVLNQLPLVRESVVIPISSQGELHLAAYYQLEGEAIEVSLLNRQLRQHLPAYMIPDFFVLLNEIPRLPNGKINRKALPKPISEAKFTSGTSAPPQGEAEEQMAALWAKVLGLATIGRHDNFFDIGGNSLKSIRLISGAKEMGIKLAPQHLFRHPTIAELVAAAAE
ncbi:MAG: amino acid adenylation domain-containing protein, partial [Bacteroidota bacterium]